MQRGSSSFVFRGLPVLIAPFTAQLIPTEACALACACFGDLNNDAIIDGLDQAIMDNSCSGENPENGCVNADLDCDGDIDATDNGILICQVDNPNPAMCCPSECTQDTECSDGDVCNGQEVCEDCTEPGACNLRTCIPQALTLQEDCNANGRFDSCDIDQQIETDVNSNGIPDSCEGISIPTVSTWTLTIMTIILLTAGTLIVGRRGREATSV